MAVQTVPSGYHTAHGLVFDAVSFGLNVARRRARDRFPFNDSDSNLCSDSNIFGN